MEPCFHFYTQTFFTKECLTVSQHFNNQSRCYQPLPKTKPMMAPSGILINACDTARARYGTRFVPTTPEHEVEKFLGKTLVVRSCHECGHCVMRDSSMDSTISPVEETTSLSWDHPIAKEFKKMLIPLSGNRLDPWGVSPEDFKPCMVLGMMHLDSMACYIELGLTCPGCP